MKSKTVGKALVALCLSGFSAAAMAAPRLIEPATAAIPVSKLRSVEFGGGGSPGGGSGDSLSPGYIHAASMTVTASPGITCDIRARLSVDSDGDQIIDQEVTLFFFFFKAGSGAPESQTASYNFSKPIRLNFVSPSASEMTVTSTTNSTGTCQWSGVILLEGF